MTTQEKIDWMENWCVEQGLKLTLEGECGLGRECVGVQRVSGDSCAYPDYAWWDENDEDISGNGEVWTPDDAYHNHPCVAVLGLGEKAVNQLYDWLVWFHDKGFKYVCVDVPCDDPILRTLGRDKHHRLEKINGE